MGLRWHGSHESSERISAVAAGTGTPMLNNASKQVAHCYRRAAECRELAERRESEREFYLEREHAWLTLARSFEFSERVGQVLNERQRLKRRNRLAIQSIWPAPKCPACKCPTCGVDMGLPFPDRIVADVGLAFVANHGIGGEACDESVQVACCIGGEVPLEDGRRMEVRHGVIPGWKGWRDARPTLCPCQVRTKSSVPYLRVSRTRP